MQRTASHSKLDTIGNLMLGLVLIVLAFGSIPFVHALPLRQATRSADPCASDVMVGFGTTMFPTLTFTTCTQNSTYQRGDTVLINLTLANNGTSPVIMQFDMQTFATTNDGKKFVIAFTGIIDCFQSSCEIPSKGSQSHQFSWLTNSQVEKGTYGIQGSFDQCLDVPNGRECLLIAFVHFDITIT